MRTAKLFLTTAAALSLSLYSCRQSSIQRSAAQLTHGDPERGRGKIRYYGCGSCHTIPGVVGGNGLVGPPLTAIANRVYIAGVLPNTPENLERWIQHPHQVDDRTAMPDLNVTASDARDIAGYLYTLR